MKSTFAVLVEVLEAIVEQCGLFLFVAEEFASLLVDLLKLIARLLFQLNLLRPQLNIFQELLLDANRLFILFCAKEQKIRLKKIEIRTKILLKKVLFTVDRHVVRFFLLYNFHGGLVSNYSLIKRMMIRC